MKDPAVFSLLAAWSDKEARTAPRLKAGNNGWLTAMPGRASADASSERHMSVVVALVVVLCLQAALVFLGGATGTAFAVSLSAGVGTYALLERHARR